MSINYFCIIKMNCFSTFFGHIFAHLDLIQSTFNENRNKGKTVLKLMNKNKIIIKINQFKILHPHLMSRFSPLKIFLLI